MHEPRPYGLHGSLKSDEDSAAVEALARRLTNIKRTGDLESLKLVRALPGCGVAIAMHMGGLFRVVVQNPPEDPEPPISDGLAKAEIPMLFSGVVLRAIVSPGQGVQLGLTDMTCRRLNGYGDQPAGARQSLQRFVIEYSDRHAEFRPEPSAFVHSQYANLRPTWFSGRMASLVQVAGGYGRQDFEALPDSPVERARMLLPERVRVSVERELKGRRLPGYSGSPPESGKIQFDYKFHETHGVGFDSARRPWLIRVNGRGVYAMPLPMVPATTTEAFREYIEEKGDAEIQWLLDQFGGMPSGEGFPVGPDAFEAWRRAGVVIKVCDAADFYTQNLSYSSAMGWSFNEAGNAAVNTCYEFDIQDGIQVGKTYMLSLSLGASVDAGLLPEEWHVEGEDGRLLSAYLSAVYRMMGSSQKDLAIRYKLRRVGVDEVLSRARSAVSGNSAPAGELEYWDRYEADPIAAHGGSLRMIAAGNVWAGGHPRTHPQIKFPEPMSKPPGCLSHDFGRLEGYPPPPQGYIVRCDTIMHAYFAGDDLKVVKYFLDQRNYMREAEDNFDECMQVGSWQQTVTEGSTSLMGRFYMSDLDARKAAAPVTTVTDIVGSDLGYDDPPHFSFDHLFSMVGSLWRNRYFLHKTRSERAEGYGLTLATCVPYLSRNAAFHAATESTSGGTLTTSQGWYATIDPNSYRYYTYDFVWAWVGGSTQGNMATATKAEPAPRDGRPVWVMGYNYGPSQCSDFADQGDWMGGLPRDYTWLIRPDKNVWNHSGGGSQPTVKQFSTINHEPGKTEGRLHLSYRLDIDKVNDDPRAGFFTMSPSEFGDVFYTDAIQNRAGETVYANCAEADPESRSQRKRWGFTRLVDHKSAHHFIGVINE